MTNFQFKKSLHSEMRTAGFYEIIKEVTEVGVNTAIIFKNSLNMKLIKWLNNRFQNGISLTEENHFMVLINTPLQSKINID